jgi:hypothetical protein
MGSWSNGGYQQGMGQRQGTDFVSLAIKAVETELVALGFKIANPNGRFGDATTQAVKNYQLTERLLSDGVVGPLTAKALFHPRIADLESQYKIPYSLLCGIAAHESSFDPGAFGSDPDDHGLVQINAVAHPDISVAQAYDPAFALEFCAKVTKDRHDFYFQRCKALAWSCAIAAWHSPVDANDWCRTGTPSDAASHYVDSVRAGCAS